MHVTKRQGSIPSRTDTVSDPIDVEQVYARYLDPIYRFLYSRVGNREDAEDLTSQVFLKAFHRLDVARGERSIVSWLYTVARSVLMDHWRQQYRQGTLAELNDNLIDCTESLEAQDDSAKLRCISDVLALLPPRSRAILELRFLKGYSVEETARALGITPANVKVTQHRALIRAADLVEYNLGEITVRVADGQAIA